MFFSASELGTLDHRIIGVLSASFSQVTPANGVYDDNVFSCLLRHEWSRLWAIFHLKGCHYAEIIIIFSLGTIVRLPWVRWSQETAEEQPARNQRTFSIEPLEARTLLSIGAGAWTGDAYVPSHGGAVSVAGVRYVDGDVVLSVSDLAGGLTRSYGTRPWSGVDQGVGKGWQLSTQPSLVSDVVSGSWMAVAFDSQDTYWFDVSGSTYTPRFGIKQSLTADTADNLFTFVETDGTVYEFNDFSSTYLTAEKGNSPKSSRPMGQLRSSITLRRVKTTREGQYYSVSRRRPVAALPKTDL